MTDIAFEAIRAAAYKVPEPNLGTSEGFQAYLWHPPTGFWPGYFLDPTNFQKAKAARTAYDDAHRIQKQYLLDLYTQDQ